VTAVLRATLVASAGETAAVPATASTVGVTAVTSQGRTGQSPRSGPVTC
jgi:hypothetical protein